MKWFDIKCPRCGWKADMVDERVAAKFRAVGFCQDCLRGQSANPPEHVMYEITEHISNT